MATRQIISNKKHGRYIVKTFSAIEFLEEENYDRIFEAIPDTWFTDDTKTFCYWPPNSTSKSLMISTVNCVRPDDSWNIYECKVVSGGHSSYASAYKVVREKCAQKYNTSSADDRIEADKYRRQHPVLALQGDGSFEKVFSKAAAKDIAENENISESNNSQPEISNDSVAEVDVIHDDGSVVHSLSQFEEKSSSEQKKQQQTNGRNKEERQSYQKRDDTQPIGKIPGEKSNVNAATKTSVETITWNSAANSDYSEWSTGRTNTSRSHSLRAVSQRHPSNSPHRSTTSYSRKDRSDSSISQCGRSGKSQSGRSRSASSRSLQTNLQLSSKKRLGAESLISSPSTRPEKRNKSKPPVDRHSSPRRHANRSPESSRSRSGSSRSRSGSSTCRTLFTRFIIFIRCYSWSVQPVGSSRSRSGKYRFRSGNSRPRSESSRSRSGSSQSRSGSSRSQQTNLQDSSKKRFGAENLISSASTRSKKRNKSKPPVDRYSMARRHANHSSGSSRSRSGSFRSRSGSSRSRSGNSRSRSGSSRPRQTNVQVSSKKRLRAENLISSVSAPPKSGGRSDFAAVNIEHSYPPTSASRCQLRGNPPISTIDSRSGADRLTSKIDRLIKLYDKCDKRQDEHERRLTRMEVTVNKTFIMVGDLINAKNGNVPKDGLSNNRLAYMESESEIQEYDEPKLPIKNLTELDTLKKDLKNRRYKRFLITHERDFCTPSKRSTHNVTMTKYLNRFVSMDVRCDLTLKERSGKTLMGEYKRVYSFLIDVIRAGYRMCHQFITHDEAHTALRIVWGRSKQYKCADDKKKQQQVELGHRKKQTKRSRRHH